MPLPGRHSGVVLTPRQLRIGPRSSYFFTLAPRDEAGARILEDLTGRGINLVANAAAQSADHIGSYFTMLRAELAFLRRLPQPRRPASAKTSTTSSAAGWMRIKRLPWEQPRTDGGLYRTWRLDSRQITTVLGMPERTVRDRLCRCGIKGSRCQPAPPVPAVTAQSRQPSGRTGTMEH
jgi:hypothetical protein